ncbi:MAG: hypothetical protein KDD51_08285 [Bdellovibrionales bacterium]|nr:hypothetical protein [Bdellovibrionales bacterium]
MKRVVFLILALRASWSGADPALHMTIVDFSTYGRFDSASAVESVAVPDPRFIVDPEGVARKGPVRFETDHVFYLGSWRLRDGSFCPTALLSELQEPALKAMLRDGYISRVLYDEVLENAEIWEPSQLRLAYTWSELTYDQANALFSGTIPWDRVLHGSQEPLPNATPESDWQPDQVWEREKTWPRNRPLRIVRSMMMVGVGQVFDPLTGEGTYKPMAWQKAKEHAAIASLDRNIFPFVAEYTRALAYSGPLAGDSSQVYRALLSILQHEARIRGYREKDVFLFARAFSRGRLAVFETKFAARRFTPELKTFFEREPQTAAENYLRLIPKNREKVEDAVVIATCRETGKDFNLTDFSQRVWKIRELSGFRLTPWQAWRVLEDFYAEVRPAYRLAGERKPLSAYPILVMNASPTSQAFMYGTFHELGLEDEGAAQAVWEYIREINSFLSDPMGQGWLEPLATTARAEDLQFGVGIFNLDERAALADPHYAAAVLLGVRDQYFDRFNTTNPMTRSALRQTVDEVRRLAGSGLPMVDYDPAEALATFDYFIGTSSPVVAAQLEALGGRRMGRPSWLGELVGGSEARVYVFSERTIATFDVPGPRPLLEHSPYRDVLSIQAGAHF